MPQPNEQEKDINLDNVSGFFETTSNVPSFVPSFFYESFRVFKSNETRRLYWRDAENNEWNYTTSPKTVTIADDAATSITPADNFGKILIHDGNAEVGEYLFDISNGSITEIADLNGNINTSTSSLGGTAGTDGKLTVSADSTNGEIDIENRLGGIRDITYLIQQ